jgi:hypothetical protein
MLLLDLIGDLDVARPIRVPSLFKRDRTERAIDNSGLLGSSVSLLVRLKMQHLGTNWGAEKNFNYASPPIVFWSTLISPPGNLHFFVW